MEYIDGLTGMYHTKVTDKNILAGNNKLFSNDEWVPPTELFGEIKVLNHSLIHEAFDRILDQHVIKQPTAIFIFVFGYQTILS